MRTRFYGLANTAFALFLLISLSVQGQGIDFENYSTPLSKGKLPIEFGTSSSEKYKDILASLDAKYKDDEQLKAFYLSFAFSIDNLLKSGRVLFNDTVGQYVNKVMANVLQYEDDKSIKPRVFVIKTNYTNAFATDNGLIFITTGLLCRLQNEAQLAFILCHELTHYKKKHSVDVFLKNKKTNQKELKKTGGYDREPSFLSKAAYSKEKEFEADLEGLKLFKKTGYLLSAPSSSFDVLKLSEHPFDSVDFDKKFFNSKNLVWPATIFLDSIDSIVEEEDTDDSLSTHPNILKRKTAIYDDLKDSALLNKGTDFIVSKDWFFLSKKISAFEYCRQAYMKTEFGEAVYGAMCLLKNNPENKYLKKIISKSLISIALYSLNNSIDKEDRRADGQSGSVKQVYHLFDTLTAKQLSVLATDYTWRLYTQFPKDKETPHLLLKSLICLANHYPNALDDFDTVALPASSNYYSSSLADSLKQGWPVETKYAFAEYLENAAFTANYDIAKANRSSYLKPDFGDLVDGAKPTHDIVFKRKDKGEKVLFFTPSQFSFDLRKDLPLRLETSENELAIFIDEIVKCANKADIPYEILSEKTIRQNGTDTLNAISLLNDWLREATVPSNLRYPLTDFGLTDSLSSVYGTKYMCLLSNAHIILEKDLASIIGASVASIALPLVSWPITFQYLFAKRQRSIYFMALFDLEEKECIGISVNTIKAKNRKDLTDSILYDFMLLIKSHQAN